MEGRCVALRACGVCRTKSRESSEYQTPTHNGVYASPERIVLCPVCAYLLAEHIAEWAASIRGES